MCGTFTIGASGAVSTQDGATIAGFTVTKTASEDGRYSVALHRTFKRARFLVQMVGTADTAFPTTTGSDPQCRNQTGSGCDVQFKRTDTQADADPASGTVCNVFVFAQDQ
jgi:hypothetical protein